MIEIGVLVFREGLDCFLVVAAITASMTGSETRHFVIRHMYAIGQLTAENLGASAHQ
jgi:hypothetical protein